ncbi:MAG: GNAT family N-acetyltransferase [Prevotella sp.]|nr:GNAT family N-acetyltransferase [Alistipes senegalensis]MCM1357952.1 GNAT family N-acetyltransferase [Prevotella sp.]MCM1472931.1 GNAT family N-acetyltransferase [Muribaculaceae bacterium]
MKIEKADLKDINELVQIRIDYLTEDYDGLTDSQAEKIRNQLPEYYNNHLNKDLFVYVVKSEKIISCCFLLVSEKPANPSFINGRTGTVMNVYTRPDFRRKGIAKKIMEFLISDAKEMKLDFIELKSTDNGYNLYKSVGFKDVFSKYHNMKIVL